MSNIWDCGYFLRCENTHKCLSCGPDQRFLKLGTDKGRKQSRSKISSNTITHVDDVSGKTLEEYVKDKLNSLPTVREYQARRQLGSGNIWFMPGDVADTVILAECKERLVVSAKGEKSITIPKTMLEKIEEEAKMVGTYPALVFRYKGDEKGKTYFTMDFDTLEELVHEVKYLRHQVNELTAERDMYKDVSQKLYEKENENGSSS